MHPVLRQLIRDLPWTNRIREDMAELLCHHDHSRTAEHCLHVGEEAERLATRYGLDGRLARIAGWLHDISAVIPVQWRLQSARELGVQVLREEETAPMILHQKLSAVIASQVFDVRDRAVLSAIACHTTLKANASALDKVVFAADKIAWDQPGMPPYLHGMSLVLEDSLDLGVLHYLEYLWQRRHTLLVLHPWFVDAYAQLHGLWFRKEDLLPCTGEK